MKRAPSCSQARIHRTTRHAPPTTDWQAPFLVKNAIVLLLPAHSRRKVVLRPEVTLDGLHLLVFEPQILHVPKRLTVRRVTDVHHKCIVARSNHLLQVMPLDKRNLRVPAPFLESALTDVVVEWA